jgi:hemerythrin-like domain-containing protein
MANFCSARDRRAFLGEAAATAAMLIGAGRRARAVGLATVTLPTTVTPATPAPEALLEQHELLNRVLLLYDEIAHRLEIGTDLPPATLVADAAGIVRRYFEDFHQRIEETKLFPRLQERLLLPGLLAKLIRQHQIGRGLTDQILTGAAPLAWGDPARRTQLIPALRAYSHILRPHEAREGTTVFPRIRAVFDPEEVQELSDRIEQEQQTTFGGFQAVVHQVGALEEPLGLYLLDASINQPHAER